MTVRQLELNWYQSELDYRIHRYRVIAKYLSTQKKVEELNKMYEFMNTNFMDIHSYSNTKNKKKHKKFLMIGIKKATQLLEYTTNISVSKELLLSFQENLKSYLKKKDLYTDIKIILLPKFSKDITDSILEYL